MKEIEYALKSGSKYLKTILKNYKIDIDSLSKYLQESKKVIVICGPTCTGKSKAGMVVAGFLDTDIISMDSMQVYRGMDIGTDKYDTERYNIKQYMVDIFAPDHIMSVVEFKEICDRIIEEQFFSLNKIPIMVGGSGLYIRSVIKGIDKIPYGSKELREKLKDEIRKNGTRKYYLKLKKVDKEYAEKISENDSRRIIRALEVYELTGLPFSDFQRIWKYKDSTYDSILIGIKMERSNLYRLIEKRVDEMFERGLLDEVKMLVDKGYANCRSLTQAVGYKEVLDYLKGKITLEDCIKEVKKNTRNLAKKQMTWFNSESNINWITADNYDNIFNLAADILKIINSRCFNEKN
ncbi:MAG: tRNA (adenosine(37)-N6)-dimethylallyltransferase MiaA [Actinomycetota bacterium]|nr:tRNA (adenosine(37)-N6)-dimethylallyltransferase MiaA [Actinomycetota bacterium]